MPAGGASSGLVRSGDSTEVQTRDLETAAGDAAPPEGSAPLELEIVLRGPAQRVLAAKPPPQRESSTASTGKHDKDKGGDLDDLLGGDSAEPPPPPPPPPGSVELAASTERLGSSVEPTAVRDVIEQSRAVFRMCSEDDASVALDVMITPSGEVGDVSSSASEPDDVRLRDCVVSAFRKLRFPPIASTESARLKLRLGLRRE